jgi:putative DNA-invertase from lambdoid prophage Rac
VELRGGVLDQLHLADIGVVMAALAEFERDLIRERVKSGIAAAKARGRWLGLQPGQRPSDRKATKVPKLAKAGLSYRLIGRHVGLSKNTVGGILHVRVRQASVTVLRIVRA